MSVDVSAVTGVGVKLKIEDLKLLNPEYDSFEDIYEEEIYDEIGGYGAGHITFVADSYDGEYLYFMYVLFNQGEYDDDEELSIDLDLKKYADDVCKKYLEIFGKELDRSRVKLISFLNYS